MDRKEREMGALRQGEEEARVEITRVEGNEENFRDELCKAAYDEDLQMVRSMLEGDKVRVISDVWELNPIRAVLMARRTRLGVADVLLRHYGYDLLLKARDPHTGNTLLHLAALLKRSYLAIFFLRYLVELTSEKLDPYTKLCFLDAVNKDGQTALHIATQNLLIHVVQQFVLEKRLNIEIKDNSQNTVFDLIKKKCYSSNIKEDWKTPWRISIMLRERRARNVSDLEDYGEMYYEEVYDEAEMGVMRNDRTDIRNDDVWNMATNTILLISTLAFAFIFAAIFTVPQTLNSGGGGTNGNTTHEVIKSLHTHLGKSTPFRVFLVSITLAGLLMSLVIVATVIASNPRHSDMRALILWFSWLCFIITGIALFIAYFIAIWIYMGYVFTSILIVSIVLFCLVLFWFAHHLELRGGLWSSLSILLNSTLLPGFIVTYLNSYFPKWFVGLILHLCPFET